MRYLPLLLLLVGLNSCTPWLYVQGPTGQYHACFSWKQGELNATITVKPQLEAFSSFVSPAADFSYAPVNHLGIIASCRSEINNMGYIYPTEGIPNGYTNDPEISLSGHCLEVGAGYFLPFGSMGLVEVFGGYGQGTLTAGDSFSSKYYRVFVQPEIGLRNAYVSLVCGVKIASQQYYDFQASSSTLRYSVDSWTQVVDFPAQHFLMVQPFLDFNAGHRFLYFNFQFGFTVSNASNRYLISDFPVFLSLGASLHFAARQQNRHWWNTR